MELSCVLLRHERTILCLRVVVVRVPVLLWEPVSRWERVNFRRKHQRDREHFDVFE